MKTDMMKKIFISYSHKDEAWKKRLVTQLSVVPDIDLWDDTRIGGGADWFQEIKEALNAAEIAILLVSADFLTSDFIKKEEIPRLLQRREQEGLIVFPVIVRACAWELQAWLSGINARPKNGKALAGMSKQKWEPALAEIAKEIFNLPEKKEQRVAPACEPNISGSCFIRIRQSGNSLFGEIHCGDPANSRLMPDLHLDDNASVSIRDKKVKLGQLVKSFIRVCEKDLVEFDDSFQLAMGQFLFDRLFPEFAHTVAPTAVDLHISTSESSLFLLPWHVLSHKQSFLASSGWSVSLSSYSETKQENCSLPKSPKVLIVAPLHSKGTAGSTPMAEFHPESLENNLSVGNHSLSLGQNLAAAYTWEEFCNKLVSFSPDVIYFYGHCTGDAEKTELCFASVAGNAIRNIGVDEFSDCIQKMSIKPVLVYLNCMGTSTGLINFAFALNKIIPAVICSRFVYNSAVAQEQGIKLLSDILTRGIAPHRAVASLFAKLDPALQISTAQARWITPLIFRRYNKWTANPPDTLSRKIHDPFWHLKIDRVSQFSTVTTQTMLMVKEGRPRSHVFVWYGTEGQGVEKFHQRLNVELKEFLLNFNAHIFEVRPEWPDESVESSPDPFRDRLIEAFNVIRFDDIPTAIRNITSGSSGKQTLVYVRHLPVRSSKLINPKTLKTYLEWWDKTFVPMLERNQFALLGISFIVNNPPKFRNLILEKERLEDLNLKHSVFRLLDEMEKLAYRDIVDFFKTHNIRLPIKNREKIIERIMEKTKGHYEKTVKQLQVLVEQSWDMKEEEDLKETNKNDDYDY
jgi:hypothetical protein